MNHFCKRRMLSKRPITLLFLLSGFYPVCSFSQQPGSVSGTKAWFVTQSGPSGSHLTDISGHKWPDFESGRIRNINFHPALFLDGDAKHSYADLAFEQGTLIGIFYPGPGNDATTQIFKATYAKRPLFLTYGQLMANYAVKNTAIAHDNVMRTGLSFGSTKAVFNSIWGHEKVTDLSVDFNGYVPELIVYNRVLNTTEIWKVQSYLAIKYGITLDTSYLVHEGNMLWNIGDPELQKFHHRVTAVGKDSLAAIVQPKSNTTYGENSYNRDANGKNDDPNEVPKTDSTSVWRSLTIGFSDKTMKKIADGTFLFWGDNDAPNKLEETEVDKINYPGMLVSKKRFLIYNQGNIKEPVKLELGGDLHGELYYPYDYLKFRYLLVAFKNNTTTVDSTRMFSYFARVIFREDVNRLNFYDNKIVWDSVHWDNSAVTNRHWFSFAKIPLMRFNMVNDDPVTVNNGNHIAVYVKSGVPIGPEIKPDPVQLNFKKDLPIVVKLNFTKGIPPYRLKVEQLTPTGVKKISEVTIKTNPQNGTTLTIDPPADGNLSEQPEDNQAIPQDIATHITRKVTYYSYVFNNLIKNTSYQFTLSDKVNQKEVLQVNISQPDPTVTPVSKSSPAPKPRSKKHPQ